MQAETIKQLQDQHRQLPRLVRMGNVRQILELTFGFLLAPIGIGALLIMAFPLDYFVFSKIYRVKNMTTGEKFSISKSDYKEYKILKKNKSKEIRTLEDII